MMSLRRGNPKTMKMRRPPIWEIAATAVKET
jgi:hypothetical protein